MWKKSKSKKDQSDSHLNSGDFVKMTDNAQKLDESLEQLNEKRSSTRESALSNIINSLQSNFAQETLLERQETLFEAVKKSLKKGGEKEQVLAAKLIPLICITVPSSEHIYKDSVPTFLELLIDNPNNEVRVAAADSLGFICFTSNDDEKATLDIMSTFAKLFSGRHATAARAPDSLKAACLNSWTLLATTIEKRIVHETLLQENLRTIVGLLKSDDVDLRVAAGEALAVLFEVAREVDGEDFKIESYSHFADIDDMLDTLYALVQDKTKQRARKDKIKQKGPLKDVVEFLENGVQPQELLEIKHQKFYFDNWAEIMQLDAFREALGTGLQTHFENNDLLIDIFNVTLDRERKKTQLSALEKRLLMSPSSPAAKARTKNLNKQRDQRAEHFNQED